MQILQIWRSYMAYNVTNEVEESNRNRIARYARDDMLVKIYKALPEEKQM